MRRKRRIVVTASLTVLLLLMAWIAGGDLLVRPIRPTQGPVAEEVERGVNASFRSEGQVSGTSCHRATGDAWNCIVRFNDGRVTLVRAEWNGPQDLEIAVEHRGQQ
jgi:hypothetical protein